MIDLSVIIVSWNAKEYLQKCVASIIRETGNYEKEVIVVDNASTDGSAELIKEQFQQVNLICNDVNLGFAKANNIGIKQAGESMSCLSIQMLKYQKDVLTGWFHSWSSTLKSACLVLG